MKQPDPALHFTISIAKSFLRLLGCVLSFYAAPYNIVISVQFLALGLILAEILGILEEIF